MFVAKFSPIGVKTWESMKVITGSHESVSDIAVDASGNVFLSGETDTASYTVRDAFVAKFNSSGSFQWMRTVDHGDYDRASSVAVTSDGKSYVTGVCSIIAESRNYIIAAGWNSAGTALFSRTISGNSEWSTGEAVAVDSGNLMIAADDGSTVDVKRVDGANGNVLLSGSYSPPASCSVDDMGVDGSGNVFLTGRMLNADYDWFLMRFTSGLAHDFTVSTDLMGDDGFGFGGPGVQLGLAGPASVYLTGTFQEADPSGCNNGRRGVAVRRYATGGFLDWTRIFDSPATVHFNMVKSDGSGNTYIFGSVSDGAVLFKYDESGTNKWMVDVTPPGLCQIYGKGIEVMGGIVFVSGNAHNPSTGAYDLFVAGFDSSGAMVYSADIDSNLLPYGSLMGGYMAVDSGLNQYLVGQYYDYSLSDSEMFVCKLNPGGTLLWTRTISHVADDYPDGIALDDSGNAYVLEGNNDASPHKYSVIKFDGSGNHLWSRDYPFVIAGRTDMNAAKIASRGSAIWFCGEEADSTYDNVSGSLYKLDTDGNVLWKRSYNGVNDAGFSGVAVDLSGNAFLSGNTGDSQTNLYYSTVSYDTTGALRWAKTYASGELYEWGNAVALGSVLVVGDSYTAGRMIKYIESAGPSAVLKSALAVTPNPAVRGQTAKVVLTVTNSGGGAATSVTPSLDVNSGGGLGSLIGGPTPAGPVTIGAGGVQKFTWTWTASGAGTVEFTATAQGINSGTNGAILTADTESLVSAEKASLESALAVWPSPAFVGQVVTVTVTVTNTGTANAQDIAATVFVGPGRVLVNPVAGPPPPAVPVLAPGASVTFTWQYTVLNRGSVVFSTTGTGTDPVFGALRTNANRSDLLKYPASLSAVLVAAPATVSVGQWVNAGVNVSNLGDVDATGVTVTLYVDPMANATQISGPASVGPVTIPAGSAVLFTPWTYSISGAGIIGFSATAQGVESGMGGVAGCTAFDGVQALLPAALDASLTALPATLRQGESFTVQLVISNTGEASASSITPLLFPVPSDAVKVVSGPVPASMGTLAGSKAVTFTWVCEAVKTPSVVFTATAGGVDANSGRYTGDGEASPSRIISSAAVLKSSMAIVPTTVKEGAEFELRYTVSDTGDLPAANVGPSLILSDPSLAGVISGPLPAVKASLASGETVVFVWRYSALKAGTLSFSLSATGDDGAFKAGTAATGSVTVTRKHDEDILVFPNPVKAATMTVALKLDADADRVDLDLYNTAMNRVLNSSWKNVARTPGEINLGGLDKFAPGVYFLRVKAVTGSTTKTYPLIKVVIKR